jgi:hypothetical protein
MWFNKKILLKSFEILSFEAKSKDKLITIAIFV